MATFGRMPTGRRSKIETVAESLARGAKRTDLSRRACLPWRQVEDRNGSV